MEAQLTFEEIKLHLVSNLRSSTLWMHALKALDSVYAFPKTARLFDRTDLIFVCQLQSVQLQSAMPDMHIQGLLFLHRTMRSERARVANELTSRKLQKICSELAALALDKWPLNGFVVTPSLLLLNSLVKHRLFLPSNDWCSQLVHRLARVAKAFPCLSDGVLTILIDLSKKVSLHHIFDMVELPLTEVVQIAVQTTKPMPSTFSTVSKACNPWRLLQVFGGCSWKVQAAMVSHGIVERIYHSLRQCYSHPDDFRVLTGKWRRPEVAIFGACSPFVAWSSCFLRQLCFSLSTEILVTGGAEVAGYLHGLRLDDHSSEYFQKHWRDKSPLPHVRWLKDVMPR